MSPSPHVFTAAAAQAAPVFLNKAESTAKACQLIKQAGEQGAKLIVFPEAFIPGYPDWVWVVPNGRGRLLDELYTELINNAISIPDESTDQICRAAEEAGIYTVLGVHERNTESSGASLYNTILYISDQGRIIGKHRKLIPTGGERMVWGQGDGSTLSAFDTPFGKLGGLLCWENLMPLARQSMYIQGVQIHAAPTWDSSDNWLLSMRHIAREGGMYLISVCSAMRLDDIPDSYEFKSLYSGKREWINPGNSCIISPRGEYITGPISEKAEILFGEIDLDQIPAAKRMFDVTGHYSRPDVFEFIIKS
jgi:nitrilase